MQERPLPVHVAKLDDFLCVAYACRIAYIPVPLRPPRDLLLVNAHLSCHFGGLTRRPYCDVLGLLHPPTVSQQPHPGASCASRLVMLSRRPRPR